ncbi:hypothetical protein LG045_02945 [Limosilactobacillus gastricus]|uniref:histidine kinase n=1 Tax=Limosilactobacillus gastricus DSM 16045 TaxID=1423749 RepID=A0A0R1VFN4_9LACO|nr:hypothetical protein [Limosilactobacillus gastricus]KRM00700.1 putative sensor kinase [Limosilactobacillus gastricus DSM 16045]QGF40150.1 hypothetical protein LG045_02945 [Limosilactobacillus gastricus]
MTKQINWYKWIFAGLVMVSLGIYFTIALRHSANIGISVRQQHGQWIITRILSHSAGDNISVAVGDQLLQIDGNDPGKVSSVQRMLLVNHASKLTILRDGHQQVISLASHPFLSTYWILLAVSLSVILITVLILFWRRQSLQERHFENFMLFFAIALVALIPSSQGIILGRIILVAFLSLIPMMVRKMLVSPKINSFLGWLTLIYTYLNPLLYIAFVLGWLPAWYWLADYLNDWGSFFLPLVLVILVFLEGIQKGQERVSRVNFSLIFLTSLIPLYLLYLYPLKWPPQHSFLNVAAFLLVPIICLLHILIVNRSLSNSYRRVRGYAQGYLLVLTTTIMALIINLGRGLPLWLVTAYALMLMIAVAPVYQEVFALIAGFDSRHQRLELFDAVENEREQVALTIHDTAIQNLILMKKQFERASPEDNRQKLLDTMDDLIHELRDLCNRVYPMLISDLGVANTIRQMIDHLQQTWPIEIQFQDHSGGQLDQLSDRQANFVLRSLQEMLINSVKHGQANQAWVQVTRNQKSLTITCQDNGTFQKHSQTSGHYGLTTIKQKLNLLGGSLVIQTYPRTEIAMMIPLESEEESNGKDRFN